MSGEASPVDADALAGWLGERLPRAKELTVVDLVSPSSTGMSNETMLYTAHWREEGHRRSASHVLRRAPSGHTVFRHYDLAVQYRCMAIMNRHGVPVPRVLWHEDEQDVLGQPFYVMERVEGVIPSDMPPYPSEGWLRDADPEQQRRLFLASLDVLAAIHAVDWKDAGFGFLDHRADGQSALDWQVADQRAYLEWACDGRPEDMPELAAGLAWLEAHRPPAAKQSATVVNWGDARISNMIFRDFRPVAVLDWEMATLGPREVDVAWFLYMDRWLSEVVGVSRLPGFPSPAAAAGHYESVSGAQLADLAWYEMFAAFRFGIHLTRIAQRLVADGIMPAGEGLDRNNGAVRSLCRLVGLDEPGEPGLLG
ncbi:MAG: phosphotransferase family protein [Acidimicrobiales bacterium]